MQGHLKCKDAGWVSVIRPNRSHNSELLLRLDGFATCVAGCSLTFWVWTPLTEALPQCLVVNQSCVAYLTHVPCCL